MTISILKNKDYLEELDEIAVELLSYPAGSAEFYQAKKEAVYRAALVYINIGIPVAPLNPDFAILPQLIEVEKGKKVSTKDIMPDIVNPSMLDDIILGKDAESVEYDKLMVLYGNAGKRLLQRNVVGNRIHKERMDYNGGTTSKKKIDEWFDPKIGKYVGCNIGIVCGKDHGVFAVDVDVDKSEVPKPDGFTSLDKLEKLYGELPKNFEQKTASGGTHYLLLWRQGCKTSAGTLGPSLDTRGGDENRYRSHIVAFPSTVRGNLYHWVKATGPISPAPQWIGNLLSPPEQEEVSDDIVKQQFVQIPEAEAFNRMFTLEQMLERSGYIKKSNTRWLHPDSSSGNPGVHILHSDDGGWDMAYSHHDQAIDPLARENAKGKQVAHTAFGIWVAHEFEGRYPEAISQVMFLDDPDGGSMYRKNAKTVVQQVYEEMAPKPIKGLNREYFLAMEGGKTLAYRWTFDTALKIYAMDSVDKRNFLDFYSNQTVFMPELTETGEVEYSKQPLAKVWWDSPSRKTYSGFVFEPDAYKDGPLGFDSGNFSSDPSKYNLWRGFAIKPESGSIKLILKHIKYIMCGGDESSFQYIIKWFAYAVQKPHVQPGVALVFRGDEGSGKGVILRMMYEIFGQHGMHISSPELLVGKFNIHLRSTVFLFADEAFFAGDKAHEGALKRVITEPTLTVEQKFKSAFTAPNYLHIAMASNEDWVVPASVGSRRFAVFDTDNSKAKDHDYFAPLYEQIKNGGKAAFLQYLLDMDLSGYNVAKIPINDSLRRQRANTIAQARSGANTLIQYFATLFEEGRFSCRLISEGGLIMFSSGALMDSYKVWARDNGMRFIVTSPNVFIEEFEKCFGKTRKLQTKKLTGKRQWVRSLENNLPDQREKFEEYTGIEITNKPDEEMTGVDDSWWIDEDDEF